jgi:hypothetical protein
LSSSRWLFISRALAAARVQGSKQGGLFDFSTVIALICLISHASNSNGGSVKQVNSLKGRRTLRFYCFKTLRRRYDGAQNSGLNVFRKL